MTKHEAKEFWAFMGKAFLYATLALATTMLVGCSSLAHTFGYTCVADPGAIPPTEGVTPTMLTSVAGGATALGMVGLNLWRNYTRAKALDDSNDALPGPAPKV